MKTLLAKLKSRKLLSTVTAYGIGIYMIRSGNVTEGIALITGAQASYNIGQGMADAKAQPEGTLLEATIERIAEPIRS